MKKISRFELNQLLPLALTFIVVGIAIAFGLSVLGDAKPDFCTGAGFTSDGRGGCWTCQDTGASVFNASSGKCGNGTVLNYVNAMSAGDSAFNATDSAQEGIGKIPSKLPLLATVVIAAVIIGILLNYMVRRY